jgi:hypothetical protein
MRIKKFNCFINENLSFVDEYEDDDIRKTIDDIFIDLEDININCDVSINDPDMDEPNILRVSFSSTIESFNTNLLKDSLPMFLDYLDEIKPDGTDDFYSISYNYYDLDTEEFYTKYQNDNSTNRGNLIFEDNLPLDIEVAWLIIMIDIIDLDWIKRTGRDEN